MIDEEFIKDLSKKIGDPEWLLEFRLNSFKEFKELEYPKIEYLERNFNFERYIKPLEKIFDKEEIPWDIRKIISSLGMSEKEIELFSGISAVENFLTVFLKIKDYLKREGIIFEDIISASNKYPKLVKKYLGKIIDIKNKIYFLNSMLFTSGTFIYIPKNKKVIWPLHTIFRITKPELSQFERTLIILDKNSEVTFVEGCISPLFSKLNIHLGAVEVYVMEGAKLNLITLQNWSKNVLNFVFSKAILENNSYIKLIEVHIGSKIAIKHPSIYLKGENSKAEVFEIMFSGKDQIKDIGVKVFHKNKRTYSKIISKSISKEGGKNVYRSYIEIEEIAENSFSYNECNSLLLDEISEFKTFPRFNIKNDKSEVSNESVVGRIDEKKIKYLEAKGIPRYKAISLLTLGFLNPILKQIPLEYLMELKRVIEFELKEYGI